MTIVVSRAELQERLEEFVQARGLEDLAWQAFRDTDLSKLWASRETYEAYMDARNQAEKAWSKWVTMRSYAKMWPEEMTP